jgi:hypothetical protein
MNTGIIFQTRKTEMRTWIILLAVFMLALPVMAQDNVLAYGDSAEGEITSREFEVEYTFEGAADDIIVVELVPEDDFEGLDQPSLILLNADNDVLTSVDASIGTATLVYELPDDGEYVILATRQDGRSGESEGAYTLTLDTVALIAPGEAVKGDMSNEETNYFALHMDAPFLVVYEHVEGDFYPEITLNIVETEFFSNDNLKAVGTLSGDELASGALGHNGTSGLMVIRVGSPLFAFAFETETVSYTLEVLDMSE